MRSAVILLIAATAGLVAATVIREKKTDYDQDLKEAINQVLLLGNSYSNQYLFKGIYDVEQAERTGSKGDYTYNLILHLRDTACFTAPVNPKDCPCLETPTFLDTYCVAQLTGSTLGGGKSVVSCKCT